MCQYLIISHLVFKTNYLSQCEPDCQSDSSSHSRAWSIRQRASQPAARQRHTHPASSSEVLLSEAVICLLTSAAMLNLASLPDIDQSGLSLCSFLNWSRQWAIRFLHVVVVHGKSVSVSIQGLIHSAQSGNYSFSRQDCRNLHVCIFCIEPTTNKESKEDLSSSIFLCYLRWTPPQFV